MKKRGKKVEKERKKSGKKRLKIKKDEIIIREEKKRWNYNTRREKKMKL